MQTPQHHSAPSAPEFGLFLSPTRDNTKQMTRTAIVRVTADRRRTVLDLFRKRFEALISTSETGEKTVILEARFSGDEIALFLKTAVGARHGAALPDFVTATFTADTDALSEEIREYKFVLQYPYGTSLDPGADLAGSR